MHGATTAKAGELGDQGSGDDFVVLAALLDLCRRVSLRIADGG